MYGSSNDLALQGSLKHNKCLRLGLLDRFITMPGDFDLINDDRSTSERFVDTFKHSYFVRSTTVLTDYSALVRGQDTEARSEHLERQRDGWRYFWLR